MRYGAMVTCVGAVVFGCARFDYELLGSAGGARFRSGEDTSLGGPGGAAGIRGAEDSRLDDVDASASGAGTSVSMDAGPTPTCSDGLRNRDETDVDCGGASCAPCPCALSNPQLMGNPNAAGNWLWSPSLSSDGLTLYVAVSVPTYGIGVATRPDRGGTFSLTSLVPAPVSTGQEGTPYLSADGLSLYFFSQRAGGEGGRDVYVATRPSTSDGFNVVSPLPEINTTGSEHLPRLTADELTLYFASTRPGTASEDILRATRGSKSEAFGAPVVVDELSSPGLDNGITLTQDGLVAFFASNRSGGLGDMDLYRAARATVADRFSSPVNLTSLNSPARDTDMTLSADGQELLFISTRNGAESQLWRVVRTCP